VFELSGYSDIHEIGAGGQAKVYVATQNSFQRKVAIKVLLPELAEDPEFGERFLREARIVAGLSHSHIVPVYDFGQQEGTLYMVMELLGGGDLSKKIERGVTIDEALQITSQIAEALHFAHEKGFVHRDVKPDNVLFRDGGSAVLTDFGIARQQNAANQLTMVGQVLGTPKYMSPEQLQDKKVDGRSDIYSLGIMFYQMCTGHAPYEDKDFTTLAMKHIQAPIPKLPQEYLKYQKLFERMVAKEPEKRFQNGNEITSLIQQIRSGKLDAANVESGNAAVLKRNLSQSAAAEEQSSTPAKRVYIPRELMIALQDLDPLLDVNWKKKVTAIYSKMGKEERSYVYSQFLQPKGVLFDAEQKQFVFYGRKSVQDVIADSLRNAALAEIANKLEKAEQMLRTTTDIIAFANMMEGGLSLIDRFDSQENLKVQKEKNNLRNAFLDDLVLIVRGANFVLPENRRSLTIEAIKTYIIEVYLKQQMMGYRFRTIPVSALEIDNNTFIKEVVALEARVRQCDVVRSDKYYFLVGPARNSEQNPYSVRRFLQEDTTMEGKVVYFNVAAIPLEGLSDAQKQEEIRWVLSRIVTLERQLSIGIVELVRDMEKAHKDQLGPLLAKPIEADGTEIEIMIEERLHAYEKNLSILVLGKIPKGVFEYARTVDDYEYLFFCLRRYIIELACDVRDFAAQSTTVWSTKAEELDLRMMSYLKMLDKRKPTLFTTARPEEVEAAMDVTLPIEEFKSSLDEFEPQIEQLKVRLKDVIRKKSEPLTPFQVFMAKVFKTEAKKITPEDVQNQIDAVKHKCLIALIKIRKRYPVITVYLEFEDLIEVNEKFRHYALPAGNEGLGRLPLLIELPEDKSSFDIAPVRDALSHDIFKAPSKWVGTP
jgi:serine/threonine protein kinase